MADTTKDLESVQSTQDETKKSLGKALYHFKRYKEFAEKCKCQVALKPTNFDGQKSKTSPKPETKSSLDKILDRISVLRTWHESNDDGKDISGLAFDELHKW